MLRTLVPAARASRACLYLIATAAGRQRVAGSLLDAAAPHSLAAACWRVLPGVLCVLCLVL